MSKPDVAIVAAGNMGAGIARVLVDHGVRVVTLLTGRSAASQERAKKAGMAGVSADSLVDVDLLLSVVPPANALTFAEATSFALKSARRKPTFVDCNAVSPATVRHIHAVIEATGTPFVDAGIIGFPPVPGKTTAQPRIYASGEQAVALEPLRECGLDIRVLQAPIGAASALKMAYAGISKGHIALFAAMVLAAERSGSAAALHAELANSEPALLGVMGERIPRSFAKAYRWGPEMEEIADFAREDPIAEEIWQNIAGFYERLAGDFAGERRDVNVLEQFFKHRP